MDYNYKDYSDVTVVIPVKNEPEVEEVVKDVIKTLKGCNIIVIYNGEISITHNYKNLMLLKQTSTGKGMACIEASKYVKTDILCFIDGDKTYEVNDLKKLIELVRSGADMAIGDRRINKLDNTTMPIYVKFGNNILTEVERIIYNLDIHDSQTGIRAMKTAVFRKMNLNEKEFGIESEMNIKAKKMGFKIVEVPVKYYPRSDKPRHAKPTGGFKLLLINLKYIFK
ncbi:MAG: glycosyltransferase family 2 protein [Candidatus Micrarchaeia archaeon]